MLNRPKFPKAKNVIVINDVPVKLEIDNGDIFSAHSNLNLLTSLRTGKIDSFVKHEGENLHKGIPSKDVHGTYLDMDYFAEGNFDFCRDFAKKKDLVAETVHIDAGLDEVVYFRKTDEERDILNCFHPLPHQKDCFVSDRLFSQFNKLLEEIKKVQPKLIIPTGKWSLFFLCGNTTLGQNLGKKTDKKPLGGLATYRASILKPHPCWNLHDCIVFPIYHTLNVVKMQDKKFQIQWDIQKAGEIYHRVISEGIESFNKPNINVILGTEKHIVLDFLRKVKTILDEKPTLFSSDVETMYHSFIDCIGVAISKDEGLCIPFATIDNPNYWNPSDEEEILFALFEVMNHPNALHVGQNYSYDCQYFFRQWRQNINAKYDTMILHHTLYNYMPKDLAFLASIYCKNYTYWKDEIEATKESPETRWAYNVKDICYTLEVCEVLLEVLQTENPMLQEYYRFKQEEVSPAIMDLMKSGVLVDQDKKDKLHGEFSKLLIKIEQTINNLLGFEINLKSSQQVKHLFKDFLGVEPLLDKKRKTETFGSAAMLVYLEQYPLYRPLISLILEYRSIGVFVRTFLAAKVDYDGMMRCNYNVAGTKSERLSSRKNAFGGGMNLQNLSAGGKVDLKFSLLSMDEDHNQDETEEEEYIYDAEGNIINPFDGNAIEGITELPNCKELFICQPDECFFDSDLSAADARIIAWESNCKFLIELFEDKKKDLYGTIAGEYVRKPIVKTNGEWPKERQQFKAVCHGTNYLGQPKTLAFQAGLLIHEVERIQKFYFGLCPEILELHKLVHELVYKRGYLTNVWGARGWFLDKSDPMLMNKAMAWVGSSPVSILINKALVNIRKTEPNITPKLQVHDSVAGVHKKWDKDAPKRIIKAMEIPIPFETPRIIPVNIKTSETSYGGCK